MSTLTTQTKTLNQAPMAESFSGLSPIATDSQGRVARIPFSPFAQWKWVTTKTDLNDYNESGLFSFTGLQDNAPCNMAGQLMLVWSHYSGYAFQVVFGFMWASSAAIYYRTKNPQYNSGDWLDWYKIDGTKVST